ncbi:YbaK/EbsC family protein [Corallincola platygyrae]|uniref:YbaK/EbsC family protein n=1 Tax=Corallincola platygyrae TaxID=1193278 RepID=A0ABW4XRA6_9GAMM
MDPVTNKPLLNQPSLNQQVRNLLEENGLAYEIIDHDLAPTCDHSARHRGTSLTIGGKSLLFKSKRGFSMFVISAACRINSNRVRKILQTQKVRFASDEELMAVAGVEKGALPPFGGKLLECELFIDETIFANQKIAFTCGSLTQSVVMNVSDYLTLVDGVRVDCCHPPETKD